MTHAARSIGIAGRAGIGHNVQDGPRLVGSARRSPTATTPSVLPLPQHLQNPDSQRPAGGIDRHEPHQSIRKTFLRSRLPWTAGFLALPLAGFAGSAVIGRADGPLATLAGGAIAGLFLGAGQTLTSSRRLEDRKRMPAIAGGMSAGLFLGTSALSYSTSLAGLALMGAINGLILGSAQALALPLQVLIPIRYDTDAADSLPRRQQHERGTAARLIEERDDVETGRWAEAFLPKNTYPARSRSLMSVKYQHR